MFRHQSGSGCGGGEKYLGRLVYGKMQPENLSYSWELNLFVAGDAEKKTSEDQEAVSVSPGELFCRSDHENKEMQPFSATSCVLCGKTAVCVVLKMKN